MKKGNVFLFGTIVLACIIYATTIMILDKNKVIDAGTFGDMFGGLNTLFTGLAFVGVVLSLFQQTEALKKQQSALEQQQTVLEQQQLSLDIQRNELELYKNELKDNTDQLKEQSEHMRFQRIESTIFNLLSAHSKVIGDISSLLPDYKDLKGPELLNKMHEDFVISELDNSNSMINIMDSREYKSIRNDELPLTNIMYILNYIHNLGGISKNQKQEFVNLLHSQFSIGLMAYYVAYLSEEEGYLKLLKTYNLI